MERDIAVDLGTSNTTLLVRGRGVVLAEPTLVAVHTADGQAVAVGEDAKRMVGRTPAQMEVVRPVQHGVIADLGLSEVMLRAFVRKAHQRRVARPRMLVCVPAGITGVEQRAVQEVAEAAGARRPVHLIETPMAAALGVGLPVHEARGSMIVVIGGGRTEVAVISLGGIVASRSVRLGGAQLDEAVAAYAKKQHSLALGERTAEEVKVVMGTAYPPFERPGKTGIADEFEAEIRGRDMISGLPRSVVVSTAEIREAIDEPVSAFVDVVKSTLDETPPDLAADIMLSGIALAGGGALLHGFDQRLADETGMPVTITGNPLHAVVRGAGHCLDHLADTRAMLVGGRSA